MSKKYAITLHKLFNPLPYYNKTNMFDILCVICNQYFNYSFAWLLGHSCANISQSSTEA